MVTITLTITCILFAYWFTQFNVYKQHKIDSFLETEISGEYEFKSFFDYFINRRILESWVHFIMLLFTMLIFIIIILTILFNLMLIFP